MTYETETNPYERVLYEIGRERDDLVVLDADLARASQTKQFIQAFPERYFDVGIAEQNMTAISAGFALSGRPVIISTFAVFLTQRACDQVSVCIAYPELNVKLVSVEPGLSSGRNGATHQAVQDLAIMRSMPNMTVMAPFDAVEIEAAVRAAVDYQGPVYLRMRRGAVPVFFGDDYRFHWGKARELREGTDVTLVSTGIMTEAALDAAEALADEGISATVLHVHTLKPLDTEAILEAVAATGCVVTVENHSVYGGLGSAVAETLAENMPLPMQRVGIPDSYGETGSNEYLFRKYGLTKDDIVNAARRAISRKEERIRAS